LEILLVIMSRTQVAILESALHHAGPKDGHLVLPNQTVKLLEQFSNPTRRRRSGGISPQTRSTTQAGLKTRMLELERRKQESVLVVSKGRKNGAPRFNPGEIAVFEIRLNHY
jgi:hypothetical protein